jgi:hypothetical protein
MDPIRSWLYIGKYRETCDDSLLRAHRIQAMLQLAELVEQPGIASLYLPVEDLEPIPVAMLRKGIDFVRDHERQGHRVLIACGAGINRSTAFVVGVLKEVEGLDLRSAFHDVKRRHPEAMPHRPVWESLCAHYQEDVPWIELIHSKPTPGEQRRTTRGDRPRGPIPRR